MVYPATLQQSFEDETFKIRIESTWSMLQLTWKQHPTSEAYRSGYEQAIQMARDSKVKYWLTDSRKVHYLRMPDQHWMYTRMLPLLTNGQLLRFALVLQPEAFMIIDRIPIQRYFENQPESGKALCLEFFLDLESAKCWFQEDI